MTYMYYFTHFCLILMGRNHVIFLIDERVKNECKGVKQGRQYFLQYLQFFSEFNEDESQCYLDETPNYSQLNRRQQEEPRHQTLYWSRAHELRGPQYGYPDDELGWATILTGL